MKPIPVNRYLFSKEEVVAALFDNAPPCEYRDIRVEGDEVVIEFVNPKFVDDVPVKEDVPEDQFPGDRQRQDTAADEHLSPLEYAQQQQAKRAPAGENEREANGLCASKAFQTFLEVKTEEAARRILLERTHAKAFSEFDTVKSWKANFRDVVAEYDMWMRG